MAEQEFIYITTTGWKSGNPHEIEIWFVGHDHAYYVVSEMREKSHWVQNVRHNEQVKIRLAGQELDGVARIVDDLEFDLLAQVKEKMERKYGWSEGLVVEFSPHS